MRRPYLIGIMFYPPRIRKHLAEFFLCHTADFTGFIKENAFGAVEFVAAEGVNGELGFVTEEMTEAAYEEKAAKLADILQMIRVK